MKIKIETKMVLLRFTARGLLWIAVAFTIIILAGSSILLFYQDRVIDFVTSELNREYQLNIKFDRISVNTLRSFPKFSYYFENFSLALSQNHEDEAIIRADEIGLSIQPFKLLIDRISIENFSAKNAIVNLNENMLNSFDSSNKSSTKSGLIVSKFILKDYRISYRDSKGFEMFFAQGPQAIVRAKYLNNQINLKSEITSENIRFKSFELKQPFTLHLEALKDNNQIFYSYNINIKSLNLNGIGKYNSDNGLSTNRFKTKRFRLTDISLFLRNKNIPKTVDGKTSLEAYIKFSRHFDYIDTLTVKHSTHKFSYAYQNQAIQIPYIEGITQFTHNFQKHTSSLQNLRISYSGIVAENTTVKLRGIDPIRILASGSIKGEFNLSENKWDIDFSGPFKVLAELKNFSAPQPLLKVVKTNAYFEIVTKNNLFNNAPAFSGKLRLSKDLELIGVLQSKSSGINFMINQPDIISVANRKAKANPRIELKGDFVEYDEIVGVFSGENQKKEKANAIEQAEIKLDFKTAAFRGHQFSNFRATGNLQGDTLKFSFFSADCFGGNISGHFLGCRNTYKTSLWLSNLDIDKLFLDFGSWGQNFVTHKNISGKFKGLANFSFSVTDKGEIDLRSIYLDSDIQIVNGKLIGMNKISKLNKWLNLEQVKVIEFDTLKNRILIENQKIIIPSMDVKSNVILMNLSGVHTFSNSYEYTARINVSRLLRNRFVVESENINKSASTDGSINLYLKLTGKSDSYRIDWINRKSFELNQAMVREIKPDSLNLLNSRPENPKHSVSTQPVKEMRIEWDEFNDTLKME